MRGKKESDTSRQLTLRSSSVKAFHACASSEDCLVMSVSPCRTLELDPSARISLQNLYHATVGPSQHAGVAFADPDFLRASSNHAAPTHLKNGVMGFFGSPSMRSARFRLRPAFLRFARTAFSWRIMSGVSVFCPASRMAG